MNDHVFPCKDCQRAFRSAEAFVDHIPTCVPVESMSVLLQQAATLLRQWVKVNGDTPINLSLKDFNRLKNLSDKTKNWLGTSDLR